MYVAFHFNAKQAAVDRGGSLKCTHKASDGRIHLLSSVTTSTCADAWRNSLVTIFSSVYGADTLTILLSGAPAGGGTCERITENSNITEIITSIRRLFRKCELYIRFYSVLVAKNVTRFPPHHFCCTVRPLSE